MQGSPTKKPTGIKANSKFMQSALAPKYLFRPLNEKQRNSTPKDNEKVLHIRQRS